MKQDALLLDHDLRTRLHLSDELLRAEDLCFRKSSQGLHVAHKQADVMHGKSWGKVGDHSTAVDDRPPILGDAVVQKVYLMLGIKFSVRGQ